ncbi:ERF family protein [Clostridioides difficile]|nr:ERF family protein [Clostridioides difficile]HBG4141505.1 ERF family protein [Clostridioides difficile]
MEVNNIYIKLMDVRIKFNKLDIKKSGQNKFANFKYFELADFLPQATELLEKAKLCPIVTFTNDYATLTLINGEKPTEEIIFTSPMRELQLKGSNELQALGGIETYQTRYLYIQLLNITENDTFDATSGKEDYKRNDLTNSSIKASENGQIKISQNQIKRLFSIGNTIGKDSDRVKSEVYYKFNKEVKDLSKQEYDQICVGYEKLQREKGIIK